MEDEYADPLIEEFREEIEIIIEHAGTHHQLIGHETTMEDLDIDDYESLADDLNISDIKPSDTVITIASKMRAES